LIAKGRKKGEKERLLQEKQRKEGRQMGLPKGGGRRESWPSNPLTEVKRRIQARREEGKESSVRKTRSTKKGQLGPVL